MGKVYDALKRSGNVFTETDVSRRTINKDALTSLEKKALGRAGHNYKQKDVSPTALSQNIQIPSLEQIDSHLNDFGLSKAHISQQTIKELNQSLRRIDSFIARPESFLNQRFKNNGFSETDFKLSILPVLLERRVLVLETFGELVGRMKRYDLGRLIKRISDMNVRAAIEKLFNELQIKDSVLRKEYQKMEESRLNIYSEQQKISAMLKESSEKRNETSEHFQTTTSGTTWIIGALLILIAILIGVAPFVKISVPEILNSAFLIILGFFFGKGSGRLFKKSS
jgi:VIT1/CCC1 family predicted Fe2+/Mn2+ transporter